MNIDYKKQRDEALKAVIMFRKMGDKEMANNYLDLAVRLNQLRTDIDPIKFEDKDKSDNVIKQMYKI